MIIGKAPIRPLSDRRQTTGGGVHFMATRYEKGTGSSRTRIASRN